MQLLHKYLIGILFTAGISAMHGCNGFSEKRSFANSPHYNFAEPKVIKLPEELDEISGLAYYPKDTSVFAIVDEAGILFKIPLKNPTNIRQWKFDKKRDFEDLVLIDSTFYVLVSDGDIESIQFHGDSIVTQRSRFSEFLSTENEFESLYFDHDLNALVMLCKSCADDPKKALGRFLYGYADSIPGYKNYTSVNTSIVADKLGETKHLKPSAAAINPVTQDLYIVSSIHSIVMVFDAKGEFKELYKLDPVLYKQPEGIAFTPDGDLIISNESAEEGPATLLLMKNKMK